MNAVRRTVWPGGFLVLGGLPLAAAVDSLAVQEAGALPVDRCSFGLPVGMSLVGALLASPFVCLLSWLSLRRFDRQTELRSDRRRRSLGMMLGGGALLCTRWRSRRQP